MEVVLSRECWYPLFHIGCQPAAARCNVAIIRADDGKLYLRTPCACLVAHGDGADDLDRQITHLGPYYRTEAECMAYLNAEYPRWQLAAPIMDALFTARQREGDIVGPSKLADKLYVPTDSLYRLARGHKAFGDKAVKAALKLLAIGAK